MIKHLKNNLELVLVYFDFAVSFYSFALNMEIVNREKIFVVIGVENQEALIDYDHDFEIYDEENLQSFKDNSNVL